MEVLVIDAAYSAISKNCQFGDSPVTVWRKELISVEDAIAKYAGKQTFQLQWKDENGLMNSLTITSAKENDTLIERISESVAKRLAKNPNT